MVGVGSLVLLKGDEMIDKNCWNNYFSALRKLRKLDSLSFKWWGGN